MSHFAARLLALGTMIALAMGAAENITIASSPADSSHGDPNLLCRPVTWADIVIFFLGNYFAHAATIITLPGEGTVSVGMAALMALLFPMTGIVRGMRAIRRFPIGGRNDLEIAARAGALCRVMRNLPTEEILGHDANVSPSIRIHGRHDLDNAYVLQFVSERTEFWNEPTVSLWNRLLSRLKLKEPESATSMTISCDYNSLKVLVALGQTLYAAITLYQTRGDQLSRYGYAAFGLTVTSYVFMSVVNLLGNLVCPTYSTMYIVRSNLSPDVDGSTILEDGAAPLSTEHGPPPPLHFDGVIGQYAGVRLPRGLESSPVVDDVRYWRVSPPALGEFFKNPTISALIWGVLGTVPKLLLHPLTMVVYAAVPVAIVGALSSFRSGTESTPAQQAWTMAWLGAGVCLAIIDTLAQRGLMLYRSRIISQSLQVQLLRLVRDGCKLAEHCLVRKIGPEVTVEPAVEETLEHISERLRIARQDIPAVEETLEHISERLRRARQDIQGMGWDMFLVCLIELVHDVMNKNFGLEEILGPGSTSASGLGEIDVNDEKMQRAPKSILQLLVNIREEATSWSEEIGMTGWNLENLQARKQELTTTGRDLISRQYLDPSNTPMWWFGLTLYAVCSIPAIGGFAVVGQMLREYGVCMKIT